MIVAEIANLLAVITDPHAVPQVEAGAEAEATPTIQAMTTGDTVAGAGIGESVIEDVFLHATTDPTTRQIARLRSAQRHS